MFQNILCHVYVTEPTFLWHWGPQFRLKVPFPEVMLKKPLPSGRWEPPSFETRTKAVASSSQDINRTQTPYKAEVEAAIVLTTWLICRLTERKGGAQI